MPSMMQPAVIIVAGVPVEVRSDGPYVARPAKDDTPDWPYWYVAGPDGRRNVCEFGGGYVLCIRQFAEEVAAVANATKF